MNPDLPVNPSTGTSFTGSLSRFNLNLSALAARSPDIAKGIVKELSEMETSGGFTPANVRNYFRKNLFRISSLAEVPGLLEEVIAQSRAVIIDSKAAAADSESAAAVIRYVVSDSFDSKVPMDFRLQLIREVPDGTLLQEVVKAFLHHETFYFPIPKDRNSVNRQGENWQANISDIPEADFRRIITALPDALPRLLASTHSSRSDSAALRLSEDQMRILCRITGNENYLMRSVVPSGASSHTLEETDRLQTGTFARIACNCEGDRIPTVFRRDIALCAANIQLPPTATCQLLMHYHEQAGPAHVLALWLAMRPKNAFDRQILNIAHFSVSTFLKPENTDAFKRLSGALGGEMEKIARIFSETGSSNGADSIEPVMRLLHESINPSAMAQKLKDGFETFVKSQAEQVAGIAQIAIELEPVLPFTITLSENTALALSKSGSLRELQSVLLSGRADGSISEENLPGLAIESLTRLLRRQHAGVTQILLLHQDGLGQARIPRALYFPKIEEFAEFAVRTCCAQEVKKSQSLHEAILQLALTMQSKQVDMNARPWPNHLLQYINLLDMGPGIKTSLIGQQVLGSVVGQVLINGDMRLAEAFLANRNPDSKALSQDPLQIGFEEYLPRILECEISGAGHGRQPPKKEHDLERYRSLGLEVSDEQLRRAVVRYFKQKIYNNGISTRTDGSTAFLSFVDRFRIPKTVLKKEFDRRVASKKVSPLHFTAVYSLARELGLAEDISTHPEALRDRRFRNEVAAQLRNIFQDCRTPLRFSIPDRFPANWSSLSTAEKAKLCIPAMAEMIEVYNLTDQAICAAALSAYKALAIAEGRNHVSENNIAEFELTRIKRMQFLAEHFEIQSDTKAEIDRQAALAKLPRPSIRGYKSALWALKFPNYPETEDQLSALDELRLYLNQITSTTLSDINLCTRSGLPKLKLNDKNEVLSGLGTIATLVAAEILNYDANIDLIQFLREQVIPIARQEGLGLSGHYTKQAFENAVIMAKQAVTNEASASIRADSNDLLTIRRRIAAVEKTFKLSKDKQIGINELLKELE